MFKAKEWSSLQKGAQPIKQYWLLKLHKKIYLLYFFEYRVHFFKLKMMLKYSLHTIHGR